MNINELLDQDALNHCENDEELIVCDGFMSRIANRIALTQEPAEKAWVIEKYIRGTTRLKAHLLSKSQMQNDSDIWILAEKHALEEFHVMTSNISITACSNIAMMRYFINGDNSFTTVELREFGTNLKTELKDKLRNTMENNMNNGICSDLRARIDLHAALMVERGEKTNFCCLCLLELDIKRKNSNRCQSHITGEVINHSSFSWY